MFTRRKATQWGLELIASSRSSLFPILTLFHKILQMSRKMYSTIGLDISMWIDHCKSSCSLLNLFEMCKLLASSADNSSHKIYVVFMLLTEMKMFPSCFILNALSLLSNAGSGPSLRWAVPRIRQSGGFT